MTNTNTDTLLTDDVATLPGEEYLDQLYEKYKSEIESEPLPFIKFSIDGYDFSKNQIVRYFFTSESSHDGDGYYKNYQFCRKAYNKHDLDILFQALIVVLTHHNPKKYLFSAYSYGVRNILHCIMNSKKYFSYKKWLTNNKDKLKISDEIANAFLELCIISDNTIYCGNRFHAIWYGESINGETLGDATTMSKNKFIVTKRRYIFYGILKSLCNLH